MHLQAIKFQVARLVIERLMAAAQSGDGKAQRVSRHQLFPQVYRFVDEYVDGKVDFQAAHPCELGLQKYIERIVERLSDGIVPDDREGEPPLLPVLNRYKSIGTTAEVDFKTARACRGTQKSHIDQVVLDTQTWEATAEFRLESSRAVEYYARNDHLGFVIPYEYQGVDHGYEPDFLVRLTNGVTVVLEIKGFTDDKTRAKHSAARRWVTAVNHWGQLGKWAFHVSGNPLLLERELQRLARGEAASVADDTEEDRMILRS